MKFDSSKKVTRDLKFKPIPEIDNLCLGHIQSVEVTYNETKTVTDKGQESTFEYAGLEVPSLIITFKNDALEGTPDNDRYYRHREIIIPSVDNNKEAIEQSKLESMYTAMFDRIKHIYDAHEGASNFKPLSANIPEIDETAAPEQRVKQFGEFFEFFATQFNKGKDKQTPVYMEGDKPVVCYIKLIAEYKSGKYLTLPRFVGEGFIERKVPGREPTIELKPNETVKLATADNSSSDDDNEEAQEATNQSRIQEILNKQKQK